MKSENNNSGYMPPIAICISYVAESCLLVTSGGSPENLTEQTPDIDFNF